MMLKYSTIKNHSMQSIVIYASVYAIYTFCVFEFRNPFEWIIDIPNYETHQRFLILFYFVFYNSASLFCWNKQEK